MRPRAIFGLLKDAFWRWWEDNTFQLGAALAFYTVFSLAPVVLIAIAVAGAIFGEEAARARLLDEINTTFGLRVGGAIEVLLQYTQDTGTGTATAVISVVVLLFGATSVFAQLQDALNVVWGVKPKPDRGWLDVIKDRFWSFAVVLGIGFLLLVSLVLSAVLASLGQFLTPASVPGGVVLCQALHWLVSFGFITLLFALVYKVLPDAKIEWEDVWVGAAVTALLFVVGKYLIGLYLGRSGWISAYGAAGSLVVVLLWVYYSSQIFLYGAEFTYVYANQAGKPVEPAEYAEPATEEARARQGLARTPPQPEATANGRGAGSSNGGRLGLNGLATFWEELRESYWGVPSVMAALSIGLAFATVAVDRAIQDRWVREAEWLYTGGPEGARAVLATVAGSMITVAGVAFSVLIVALSLASSQFGPRLLRTFMRDRGHQLVLGTFTATFLYCLLVLRTVRDLDDREFVPNMSVTVAVLLAVCSLGVLIYFIHHAAVSIQASHVIAEVGGELHACIDRLFPEELGQETRGAEPEEDAVPASFEREARPVAAAGDGYVQAVENDQLLKLAAEHDLLVRLARRPGHFVVKGSSLAHVWPGERLNEALAGRLRATFQLGPRPTPTQDVEFAVEQLVEVAVRALSAGVNDPFTATTCVDRLGAALWALSHAST